MFSELVGTVRMLGLLSNFPGRRPAFRGIHRGRDIVVSLIISNHHESYHENHSGRFKTAADLEVLGGF